MSLAEPGAGPTDITDDVLALARGHDRDRYIGALLAPADRRTPLLTLQAFDADLARIPVGVSEPLLGEIRLQWWRDALGPLLTDAGRAEGAGQARTGNPLADSLMDVARRYRLPGGILHGLIDARSAELSDAPLADEAQLAGHLAKTDGAMIGLAAQILGHGTLDANAAAAVHGAGQSIGRVRLARDLMAARPTAELLVPLSIWSQADRDNSDAETVAASRRKATALLLTRASETYEQVRPVLASLPRTLRPAFLPLALVPRYVTHLQGQLAGGEAGYRDLNPMVRFWTLWRAGHKARML